MKEHRPGWCKGVVWRWLSDDVRRNVGRISSLILHWEFNPKDNNTDLASSGDCTVSGRIVGCLVGNLKFHIQIFKVGEGRLGGTTGLIANGTSDIVTAYTVNLRKYVAEDLSVVNGGTGSGNNVRGYSSVLEGCEDELSGDGFEF